MIGHGHGASAAQVMKMIHISKGGTLTICIVDILSEIVIAFDNKQSFIIELVSQYLNRRKIVNT
jgi:hypothetical protein